MDGKKIADVGERAENFFFIKIVICVRMTIALIILLQFTRSV